MPSLILGGILGIFSVRNKGYEMCTSWRSERTQMHRMYTSGIKNYSLSVMLNL